MGRDVPFARQAEVCIDWSSFLPLGCQLEECGVPFVCCRHLGGDARFAVESERWPSGVLHGKLCSFCWIMYVAVGATLQRHGDSLKTVKTLSVFRVYEDDLVFFVHCARGPCMFGPRGSLALCQMHFSFFSGTFTLIIVSFGTSC